MSINWSWLFCALAVVGTPAATANTPVDSPPPLSILLRPDRVFVPFHFNENDNARFVFEATLISSCEEAGPSKVHVDKASFTVTLEAWEFIYSGCWCAPVESTYSRVVRLGPLPAGTYTIQARIPDGSLIRLGRLAIGSN